MPIRTKCPSCKTAVSVPGSATGKSARCQTCQHVFKIPVPSRPAAASSRPAAPGNVPKTPAPAGRRVIKCPGCQSGMRIPAGSQGEVFACPRCQTRVRVGGTAAAKSSAAVKPTSRAPAPLPPATSNAGSGGLDDFDFGDLGTGKVLGANPYMPPSPGFGAANAVAPPRHYKASAASAGRSEVLYIIPGVMILIWSIFALLMCILRLIGLGMILFTQEMPPEEIVVFVGMAFGSLVPTTICIVMAVGSVAMIRRTGLSGARTAAILAFVPCFGGCVFPIGIWATVLLFTGSVEKDFSG